MDESLRLELRLLLERVPDDFALLAIFLPFFRFLAVLLIHRGRTNLNCPLRRRVRTFHKTFEPGPACAAHPYPRVHRYTSEAHPATIRTDLNKRGRP